jgi:hypothetical protein
MHDGRLGLSLLARVCGVGIVLEPASVGLVFFRSSTAPRAS